MPAYLTVKEASKRIGKSPSSIRRLIYPIIGNDHHPDREHIHPTVSEALEFRTKGENFAWRISDAFLQRAMPSDEEREKQTDARPASAAPGVESELLKMLRRELDIKNQQITQQTEMMARQMELISGLSERLREGNVLIGSLQQRLSLGAGPARSAVTDVQPTKSGGGESAAKKAPKPQKPKRSFLSRLFR